MTLITYKAIAALMIFLTSIATVIYPLKHKNRVKHGESLELGEAFASGIFLGVAFFHMLPNSISTFNQLYPHSSFPVPEAIMVGGFLLLLFLERLSFSQTLLSQERTIPYILAVILIIHSVTEGAALGIGNMAEAVVIFIAIIAHKGSASFALCVTLMRYNLPFKQVIFIIVFFSFMTPLGIALGGWINTLTQSGESEFVTAAFNAFAAGTFLYIATLHHIRFHQRLDDAQGLLEFVFLTIGLVAMGIIAIWA